MSSEYIPSHLASGETGVVHVTLARSAAFEHVAKNEKWRSLTLHRLAEAGQWPETNDFSHHHIVPDGHVAIQIRWRQESPDSPVGVPIEFHQEVNEVYTRNRLLWWIMGHVMTRRSFVFASSPKWLSEVAQR